MQLGPATLRWPLPERTKPLCELDERSVQQTPADGRARFQGNRVVDQMLEAVAIIIGLFGISIFAAHALEAHLTPGDWLSPARSASSTYQRIGLKK
jgi:hypothetical protein